MCIVMSVEWMHVCVYVCRVGIAMESEVNKNYLLYSGHKLRTKGVSRLPTNTMYQHRKAQNNYYSLGRLISTSNSKTIIANWIIGTFTYCTQCAAVKTHSGWMRVPPHKCFKPSSCWNEWLPRKCSDTNHGHSPARNGCPPTTRL